MTQHIPKLLPDFYGLDLSLNHGAVVKLDGNNIKTHFYTDKITYAIKAIPLQRVFGKLIRMPTQKEKETAQIQRLQDIRTLLQTWLPDANDARDIHRNGADALDEEDNWAGEYAALEGYAYGAQHQAHQLGELGGVARMTLMEHVPFRIHAPTTVKKFLTGNGNAKKEEMIAAAQALWNYPTKEMVETLEERTIGDIADALTLAHMARIEYGLRQGDITLANLPAAQRTPFELTKKSKDGGLLARDWI